jgi:hypothetical protein
MVLCNMVNHTIISNSTRRNIKRIILILFFYQLQLTDFFINTLIRINL